MSTELGAPLAGAKGPVKPITLALQGGGAHGAFAWGVLDRLSRMGGSPSKVSVPPVPAP